MKTVRARLVPSPPQLIGVSLDDTSPPDATPGTRAARSRRRLLPSPTRFARARNREPAAALTKAPAVDADRVEPRRPRARPRAPPRAPRRSCFPREANVGATLLAAGNSDLSYAQIASARAQSQPVKDLRRSHHAGQRHRQSARERRDDENADVAGRKRGQPRVSRRVGDEPRHAARSSGPRVRQHVHDERGRAPHEAARRRSTTS